MVNEIKLDGLVTPQSAAKTPRKDANATNATAHAANNEGITISSHIGTLAMLSIADNTSLENQQRVMEIKQQVQHNQYRVDVDALATKLAHTLFNTKSG